MSRALSASAPVVNLSRDPETRDLYGPWHLIRAIGRDRRLSLAARFLAPYLMTYVGPGGVAFVGQAALMRDTGMSERHLRDAFVALKGAGHIVERGRSKLGTKRYVFPALRAGAPTGTRVPVRPAPGCREELDLEFSSPKPPRAVGTNRRGKRGSALRAEGDPFAALKEADALRAPELPSVDAALVDSFADVAGTLSALDVAEALTLALAYRDARGRCSAERYAHDPQALRTWLTQSLRRAEAHRARFAARGPIAASSPASDRPATTAERAAARERQAAEEAARETARIMSEAQGPLSAEERAEIKAIQEKAAKEARTIIQQKSARANSGGDILKMGATSAAESGAGVGTHPADGSGLLRAMERLSSSGRGIFERACPPPPPR